MDEDQARMMISGEVRLKCGDGLLFEVRRCMAVIASDGCKLGIVAAVCFEPRCQEVAAVLLGHLPPTADYRLIPVDLIDQVNGDSIHLRLTAESAEQLERYRAGECEI